VGDAVGRATIEDLVAITGEQREFWGERDMSHLHHPMLVHEFGQTSVVIRSEDGPIVAYLFGFVTLDGRIGYAHLVAVRSSHRRLGLGRSLYENFEALARERDAVALKAYTRPENTQSISFHRSIGMSVSEVADYSGPGENRVVFRRELA
jgi:ribosomal protein S18 acetylase RimI-like enzyme